MVGRPSLRVKANGGFTDVTLTVHPIAPHHKDVVKHALVQQSTASLIRVGDGQVQLTAAHEGAGFDPESIAAAGPGIHFGRRV